MKVKGTFQADVGRYLSWRKQFSALPSALTGREVLRLYARLRGVPGLCIEAVVTQLLQRIDLAEYADRREALLCCLWPSMPCSMLSCGTEVWSCMRHHEPAALRNAHACCKMGRVLVAEQGMVCAACMPTTR